VGVGKKYPYYDFVRGVLTEEMLLRKSKKLPEFLLQNITWLRTSNCDAGQVEWLYNRANMHTEEPG